MKVWFWPRIATEDDTINPNLISFPAMTFQFPLASTSPSLLGRWLEWCLNTSLVQLDTEWHQLQHQGLWLFCAVLTALGKDAAWVLGFVGQLTSLRLYCLLVLLCAGARWVFYPACRLGVGPSWTIKVFRKLSNAFSWKTYIDILLS